MMVSKMADSCLDGHRLGKSGLVVVLSTDVAGAIVGSIVVQMAVVERTTKMKPWTEEDP